jgi:hypothetical protein
MCCVLERNEANHGVALHIARTTRSACLPCSKHAMPLQAAIIAVIAADTASVLFLLALFTHICPG